MNKIKLLLTTILIGIFLTGCTSTVQVNSKDLFYMDTYINIKIYSNDKDKANNALNDIDKMYKDYHQLTDRYNAYDNVINVYYLNHELALNKTVTIDKRLYDLTKYVMDFCQNSNGFLNIALGNVIDVWKSYRDKGEGIPTMEELQNSGSTNINDIQLLDNYQYLKKSNVTIDLGGFAKGYVTELAGQYLEDNGLNQYIINAGGNVKVGNHYNKGKYKIGVENPLNSADIYKVVKANNVAVVTSGGYERFYEYKGQKYHHIIDPNTLFPPHHMLSVTVISPDSKLADSLDTLLFLMPIEEGIKYVDKLDNVEAVWYGVDKKIYYSKGFDKYE